MKKIFFISLSLFLSFNVFADNQNDHDSQLQQLKKEYQSKREAILEDKRSSRQAKIRERRDKRQEFKKDGRENRREFRQERGQRNSYGQNDANPRGSQRTRQNKKD